MPHKGAMQNSLFPLQPKGQGQPELILIKQLQKKSSNRSGAGKADRVPYSERLHQGKVDLSLRNYKGRTYFCGPWCAVENPAWGSARGLARSGYPE